MVIFTARQNLANLNEVKINLIVKFANLAGKSYTWKIVFLDLRYILLLRLYKKWTKPNVFLPNADRIMEHVVKDYNIQF